MPAIKPENIRTPTFLVQAVCLGFNILGAIIAGATIKRVAGDRDRWVSAVAIAANALLLLGTLLGQNQYIPAALGLFMATIGTLIQQADTWRLLKQSGPTAGFAISVMALGVAFASLLPWKKIGSIGKGFVGLRNIVGTLYLFYFILFYLFFFFFRFTHDKAKIQVQ